MKVRPAHAARSATLGTVGASATILAGVAVGAATAFRSKSGQTKSEQNDAQQCFVHARHCSMALILR
jgi:hypothetical protein